ncbi:MAG TPA: hypothetical protein VFQ33_09770 [Xanthobacteraceae bacterium]|nr:hypothetical protein [Xanthobacteraceae bacterium]
MKEISRGAVPKCPKLLAAGFSPVGLCGADFAVYLRKQHDEYDRVIRAANIKVD